MTSPRKKRQVRKAKRTFRRSGNVKRSRARQNDWTARVEQDWDEIDYDPIERVMPRDERDRRKQIEEAVIASPLTSENDDVAARSVSLADVQTALVTEVAGLSARIEIRWRRTPGHGQGPADRDRHRLHQSRLPSGTLRWSLKTEPVPGPLKTFSQGERCSHVQTRSWPLVNRSLRQTSISCSSYLHGAARTCGWS